MHVLTHAHGTAQPAMDSSKAPTQAQSNLPQSQMPSYALQQWSFSWPTASLFKSEKSIKNGLKITYFVEDIEP